MEQHAGAVVRQPRGNAPGREPGQMVGKSEYLHAVHVPAPNVRAGDLRRVRIVKSMQNSLTGALIDDKTG